MTEQEFDKQVREMIEQIPDKDTDLKLKNLHEKFFGFIHGNPPLQARYCDIDEFNRKSYSQKVENGQS